MVIHDATASAATKTARRALATSYQQLKSFWWKCGDDAAAFKNL